MLPVPTPSIAPSDAAKRVAEGWMLLDVRTDGEWAEARIPEDKVLVPGVIDTTTNFIEHPELVAERVCRFAEIVGSDRVMAGTDCGFGTWAGFGPIDPDICWAKLRSLSEGAAFASERLG